MCVGDQEINVCVGDQGINTLCRGGNELILVCEGCLYVQDTKKLIRVCVVGDQRINMCV